LPELSTNNKEISFARLVVLIMVCILLILFDSLSFFKPIKDAGSRINNKITADSVASIDRVFSKYKAFEEKETLIKQINELHNENLNLVSQNTSLTIENKELATIKEQNKFSNMALTTPALVASYVPDKFGHIVINKGSTSGIKEGDSLVLKNFLLGEIVTVNTNTSEVRLISSPESTIPATSLDNNAQGIIKGNATKGLVMEDIPSAATLLAGEIITTNNINSKFAKGLILGEVKSIQDSPNQATKKAEIGLLMDLTKLNEVFIISQEGG